MERVNFQAIEKKWQKKFLSSKLSNPKVKILLFRNVSLSLRENSHGSREKLHNWRRDSKV